MKLRWFLAIAPLVGACSLFEPAVEIATPDPDPDLGMPDTGMDASFEADAETPVDSGPDASQEEDAGDVGVEMPPSGWIDVSAGTQHTCAIAEDGRAYCWGRDEEGRLGTGEQRTIAVPTPVSSNQRFVRISAGDAHTCAIDEDGALYCWGDGTGFGASGATILPTLVDSSKRFVDVSAGFDHTCVVDESDGIYCAGDNTSRQSGNFAADFIADFTQVVGLSSNSVTAGRGFTCALDLDSIAHCWGRDVAYGFETSNPPSSGLPAIQSDIVFESISASDVNVCALTSDGRIFCWGDSVYDTRSAPAAGVPAEIQSPYSFTSVSTGYDFGCGMTESGVSVCWGNNYRARMGIGGANPSPSESVGPTRMFTNETFRVMSTGYRHGCAITAEAGELMCWGRELFGRVGVGRLGYSTVPTRTQTDIDFVRVAAGRYHTCGVATDGRVACWGRTEYKAFPIPNGSEQPEPFPVYIGGLQDIVEIDNTDNNNCAISSLGALYCWGRTDVVLGTGNADPHEPNVVVGNHVWTSFSLGDLVTCGTTASGSACWGEANFIGEDVGRQIDPYFHTIHPAYRLVAAGAEHVCGVEDTAVGKVYCWGENDDGQLGDGTTTDSLFVPVEVGGGLVDVIDIAAGDDVTCAINRAGELFCWGKEDRNGGGVSADVLLPERVMPGRLFQQADAKRHHLCAISDGDLFCWGSGEFGRIGNGSFGSELSPQQVSLPFDAIDVSVDVDHTCAALDNGDVYCWGLSEFGTFGNGESGLSVAPTRVDLSLVE